MKTFTPKSLLSESEFAEWGELNRHDPETGYVIGLRPERLARFKELDQTITERARELERSINSNIFA